MSNNAENCAGDREGYIPVTGGLVWYRMTGPARRRVPLLTLHGGPGAPHDYLEPLEDLADERPVIFYDQLGCGKSDRPDAPTLWTVGHFIEELGQVRQALGLERLHLLGQSWGGMLAVEYLLARGLSGVASLILSAPFLSTSRFVADQRAYLQEMPAAIRRVILDKEASGDFDSPEYQEAMAAYYRRHLCRLDPWPDCLNRAFAGLGVQVYRQMWGPSEFTMTGNLGKAELVACLRKISLPVLLTCGRYDESTPETTAYYQSRWPGAEMVVFEEASHMHHLEKQEHYLDMVRGFLRRVESAAAP
ncbi:MAG: proline iminopeptidase-family hydrolase [Deltaproteobacteria bacterium]|nr:proline iminopeptidase-family hydrolase [Deltaproteobacteria bacterium]